MGVAAAQARGEHQRNGVKVKTSNGLNLVTKRWLKRLDLLPCAQALLLPVQMVSHRESQVTQACPQHRALKPL